MSKLLSTICLNGALALGTLAGCRSMSTEQVQTSLREIVALAEEGKVAGTVHVTLNGAAEAGLKESIYLGSPGSHLTADLQFKFDTK